MMSELDVDEAYCDLSSDEGPVMDDPVNLGLWEAMKDEMQAWLVRAC